ncbi:MAG: Do family serine endopeptidase [Terriglobales bacterium]
MNANARRVLANVSKKTKLYALGVLALAATVAASTGMLPLPRITASGPVIKSNMAPVAEATIAPLLALDRATEAVASRITPAVVNISIDGKTTPTQMQQEPGPDNIPAPFRQFFEQGPMRPQSQLFHAEGSGVIISPDGYIVTNNHVVNGALNVTITLSDKRNFNAKVVGTDKATDLAVVKINATALTSATFGDSSEVKPGETVLAIGDPMGMDFSVTRGIVSAVNRPRSQSDGQDSRGSFIQTDAPINHGNSGGPLVNAEGEVIGINTEMLSSSGASAGIGFAIPSNLVKSTAAQLIEHGKVLRGYLGITVSDLTPAMAGSMDEPGVQGALVNSVNAGSPAASAGLKPYDVITGMDGKPIDSGTALQTITGGTAPGATVHLKVLHDGHARAVAATLGNFDEATTGGATAVDAASGGNGTPKLGVTVEALTPQLRSQMQLPDGVNGVLVDSVTAGGPAMVAGISQGMVIEQINQHQVSSPEGLKQQLGQAPAGKAILLMVHDSAGNHIVPVNPN